MCVFPTFIERCGLCSALCPRTRCTCPSFSQLSSSVAGCVQLCVQEPSAPFPHFPNIHRVLQVEFSCVSKNPAHLSLIFPTFIESCRLSSAVCPRTRCTFASFSQLSSSVAGCVQLCVQEPGAPVPHFPNIHRELQVEFSCVSKNPVHLCLIFPTFIECCRLCSAVCPRTWCTCPSFSQHSSRVAG